MRASQLTGERRRRQLARRLRGIIKEARYPRLTRPPLVTINRAAVREAEEEINALIARLNSPELVRAEGVVIVERMISNQARSPLYRYTEEDALRRLLIVATAALDLTPPRT